jgi:hypothetical protein
MRGSGLRNLVRNGGGWSSPDLDWNSLGAILDRAYAILDEVGAVAAVHGDVHLRNILCSERDAHLIDFANCGPGHPAFDLVRLECAMTFGYLRQVDTEDSFMDLQRAISVDLLDETELQLQFENWFESALNATLLRAALYCRNACIDVLAVHGADARQYLVAKFAMACRSMDIPNLQTSLIRGAIRAFVSNI